MQARIAFSALSALVFAAFAGNALADDPTVVNDTFHSTKTRAEVAADPSAYRQAGVNPWSTSYQPLKTFHSTTSRAAVTGEYLASRDEVRALTSEDSGSAYLAQAHGPAVAVTTLAGTPTSAQ